MAQETDLQQKPSPSLSTHLENANPLAPQLTQEHRNYLLERHGTLELQPVPSMDPGDPYNWPSWRKNVNIALVSFHAMMATFMSAGIIPAFENLAQDLGCSLTKASYLTSMTIVILGFSPLFWKPIAHRYGRRPVWLISTLVSCTCNIGCAKSKTYGTMAVARVFASFFISPASAIGTGVVTETFFVHQRGQKLGIWALLVTLGPPSGPFFMGFVINARGWQWVYWSFAIINAAQFLAYIFLSPETRYIRPEPSEATAVPPTKMKNAYFSFRRVDTTPFNSYEFIEPALLARFPSILLPTLSYSLVFGYASVMMTVEVPQLFVPKWHFNAQQVGYQFAGMIIGSALGEQFAGPFSDYFLNRRAKKLGHRPPAEYRLRYSHLGFVLVIVGLIVFGVQLQNLNSYNITPIVGVAIAAFGNQIVTTICVTYAVDSHTGHSASVGVFINLIRSTWAFIGPFYYPYMFSSRLGVAGSCGLMAGLVGVISVPLIVFAQWKGQTWKKD